ncbi:NUDIX hydrolase [Tissierella sp. Yu-01]|uniref:NUDIX domain-containing protein n=1 Tax=Tissierella sp. Yu-01 TaxID=3035694 RepID=UPI00240DC5A8|nr:NUDIX hydrolase [Tissierella sp. Yu-01]WFA09704.1 NUDIX hydrolase [Tissierella sp. Yu-01]
MVYEEKTMKCERIYEGKILNLRIDTVELPEKKYSKREIVEHPGGVGIVTITDDNSIILVKQYRKAVNKTLLEIPAGKLEVNEEPRETAIRELKEETGYDAKELKYLLEFYTSPGYCNEKIYLFLASDLVEGDQKLDEGEYCEIVKYSFDELLKMIDRGEIIDSKTIIGIFAAKDYIQNRI